MIKSEGNQVLFANIDETVDADESGINAVKLRIN